MSNTLSIDGPPADTRRRGVLPGLDPLRRSGAALLIGLLLLRTVLLTVLVAALGLARPSGWPGSLFYANALIIAVDAITIVAVVAMLRRGGVRLSQLIAWRGWHDVAWSLLVTLIVVVGFFVASYVGNLIAYQGPPPAGAAVHVPLWVGLLAPVAAITIAVAEETLYRGVLLDQLVRRVGRTGALGVVTFFFALQHAPLAWISPQAITAKLITTFLAGLLLGAIALRMRRLGPLVVAHAVLDVIGLGLPTLLTAVA